jgi:hypothetical protein
MVMAWGVGVIIGMTGLFRYQMTPGARAQGAPSQWPASVSIPLDTQRLNLVMTLHPQCPCSRASLHELAELMARAEGRINSNVLFVEPAIRH